MGSGLYCAAEIVHGLNSSQDVIVKNWVLLLAGWPASKVREPRFFGVQ